MLFVNYIVKFCNMENYVYRGGVKRPSLTKCLRLLYILNRLPLVHGFAAKRIKKILHIPNSVLIKQGFFCTSTWLKVGEGTGLADTFIIAV